jgi:DNA-binding NtrC family response regulator
MNEFSGIKLLVVDDDLAIIELVEQFFSRKGMNVISATSGEEAFEMVNSMKQKPDLIVVDLNLPNMSGIELTKKLSATERFHTPIFVMTASSDLDLAFSAIDAGATDFIVKPIHLSQFQISMARALRAINLETENDRLRLLAKNQDSFHRDYAGRSVAWRNVVDLAKRVAQGSSSVLLSGESGTGSEVISRSSRSTARPYQKICSSLNFLVMCAAHLRVPLKNAWDCSSKQIREPCF